MRTIFTVFWTQMTTQSASSPKDQLSIYKKYLIMNNYMFFQTQTLSGGLALELTGRAHVWKCWEDCGSGTDWMEVVLRSASASKWIVFA